MSEPFNLEMVLIDARRQAEEILRQAHEKESILVEETQRQANRLYREMLSLQEKECRAQQRKVIIDARLNKKRYLFGVKQELVDEFLQSTAKETGGYEKAIVALREKYAKDIAAILFSHLNS